MKFDELEKIALIAVEKYGDSISISKLNSEGISTREFYSYFSSMQVFREKYKLKPLGITKETFDSLVTKAIEEHNGFISYEVLQAYGIWQSAIEKYYENITTLKEHFGVSKSISGQDSFIPFLEKLIGYHINKEAIFDTLVNPKSGKKLRFDGYVPELNLLIEYDDPSHFMKISNYDDDLIERQWRDNFKNIWASSNGFILYRFKYTDSWNSEDIKRSLEDLGLKLDFKSSPRRSSNIRYQGIVKANNNKGKFRVTLKSKLYQYYLGDFDDELYAALIREKFIRFNDLVHARDNFTDSDLKACGFSSWEDVPLVAVLTQKKGSDYVGVHKKDNGKYFGFISGNGERYRVNSTDDPLLAAIYRNRHIDYFNLKQKKHTISLEELNSYGFTSWEEVPVYKSGELIKEG